MQNLSFLETIGHLSFALGAIGWLMRDATRIRTCAVIGLALSLVFNGIMWMRADPSSDLRSGISVVLFWVSVNFLVNIWMLARHLYTRRHRIHSIQDRAIFAKAFPRMTESDAAILSKMAIRSKYLPGTTILTKGGSVRSVILLADGVARTNYEGDDSRLCHAATIWGDLTYTLGKESFNRSPCDIQAATEVITYEWSHSTLRSLAKYYPSIEASMLAGFILSQAKSQFKKQFEPSQPIHWIDEEKIPPSAAEQRTFQID